jgi:hypothetical protein
MRNASSKQTGSVVVIGLRPPTNLDFGTIKSKCRNWMYKAIITGRRVAPPVQYDSLQTLMSSYCSIGTARFSMFLDCHTGQSTGG